MSLIVHADAQQEADSAAAYYDNARPGLGRAFLEAVDQAVQLAAQVPKAFSPVIVSGDPRDIRKKLVQRFPYTVFYEVRATDIVVLAVSHQSRRPLYWVHRRAP